MLFSKRFLSRRHIFLIYRMHDSLQRERSFRVIALVNSNLGPLLSCDVIVTKVTLCDIHSQIVTWHSLFLPPRMTNRRSVVADSASTPPVTAHTYLFGLMPSSSSIKRLLQPRPLLLLEHRLVYPWAAGERTRAPGLLACTDV